MQSYNLDALDQQGNPQIETAHCPMPISYASPRLPSTISKTLAESLGGQWPPKRWKSLDSHTHDLPVCYLDGSFNGGAGGSGDVPQMWQSSSNARQKPAEHGVPKSAPAASQVLSFGYKDKGQPLEQPMLQTDPLSISASIEGESAADAGGSAGGGGHIAPV